jgi:DNA-binding GntR family transcriptional regulator
MSGSLVPARRRGLADEVADRIRDAIFDGGYAPGSQLREVELAQVLGVSREWHRGATVTALSGEDVAELDSLRAALEHLAVELVVERAADDALTALEAVVRRMERAHDEHEMVRYDLEFHDAVYAATGHRRLLEAWQAIRSQVHLFLLTRIGVATDGYLAGIPAEHRELVAALRARDRETALALFAEHRRHAFEILNGRTTGGVRAPGPPPS